MIDSNNFIKNNLNAYQNVNMNQNNNNNFANPILQNKNNQIYQYYKNIKPGTQILSSSQMNINNMYTNITEQFIIPKKLNLLLITWNVRGI